MASSILTNTNNFHTIWPKDRTLIGTTTLGQSEPGKNGNEVEDL